MQLNPILTRETRARWRGRAFALLFCGVTILAVAMVLAYESATRMWVGDSDRTARIGAQLFRSMTYYQMAGWMLLAPSLTATAIAGEREQGLLEGLQLSRLSAGQIVRGKLYSALAFIGLLLLATQPVMAICFLLGGVSPGEFVGAFVQIFLTALAGAALGLCVSAWSRRSAHAAGTTLACVLIWGFGSLFLFYLALYLRWSKASVAAEVLQLLVYLAMINPVFAHLAQQNLSVAAFAGFVVIPIDPEPLSRYLLCGATVLLLLAAVRAVRRPFAEQYWVETFAAPPKAEISAAPPPKTKPSAKTTPGLVHLPLTRLIRFRNPILQRDLRAKLLFRRPSPVALFFQLWLLAGLAYAYYWLLREAYSIKPDNEAMWALINGGALFGLIIAPAVVGATAITREHESGTWQGVRLSLLSAGEIIFAKQVASLAITPLLILLILPFVPACLLASESYNRITLWEMSLTFLLHAATAWFAAAWGLSISNRCRKTAAATSWTLGSLFLLLIIAPGVISWALYDITDSTSARAMLDFLASAHPFGAFSQLLDYEYQSDGWHGDTLRGVIFLFTAGSALLLLLKRDLEKSFIGEE